MSTDISNAAARELPAHDGAGVCADLLGVPGPDLCHFGGGLLSDSQAHPEPAAPYDANGPYRGVNYAALVATAVGVAAALSISSISWYASLIPAGLSYYLLMQYWPACARFRQ